MNTFDKFVHGAEMAALLTVASLGKVMYEEANPVQSPSNAAVPANVLPQSDLADFTFSPVQQNATIRKELNLYSQSEWNHMPLDVKLLPENLQRRPTRVR